MTPPIIYVPVESLPAVMQLMDAWRVLDQGALPCDIRGIATGESVELHTTLVVKAFATVHAVPSRGYIVYERRKKVREEYAECLPDELRELRQGGTDISEDHLVPLLCYTGDTSPQGLDNEADLYRAKVLITEMSFSGADKCRENIHRFGHCHLEDYRERADRFENELIIAMHLSTRETASDVRKEIQKRFPEKLQAKVHLWACE